MIDLISNHPTADNETRNASTIHNAARDGHLITRQEGALEDNANAR